MFTSWRQSWLSLAAIERSQELSDGSFCRRLSAAFIAASALGIACRAGSFDRYVTGLAGFFDAGHYINIARRGYEVAATTCFYPLWPLAISFTTKVLGVASQQATALTAGLLSAALFFGALRLMIRLARTQMPRLNADLVVVLFALNPHSLFHVIAYSESLCSVLLLLLVQSIGRQGKSWQIILWSLLTGMARPLVVFIPFAISAAAVLGGWRLTAEKGRFWRNAVATTAGSLAAFGIYASYLFQQFGNPLASFEAQNAWGRSLGLHFELIIAPKVVGGSTHVLVWDLIAFYAPLALTAYSLVRQWRRQAAFDQVYWFCLLLAVAHGATQFLTYPLYASLGRHVFGLPLFFLALGQAMQQWQPSREQRAFMVVFSALSYVRWWTRFAKGSWIG